MSRLKTLIDANIKENGNQEITGNVLNYVLTEIADEVKREGYFPDMSVGFADNLVGRGESVPAEFSFRASGGKSIKDGTARIKRIKGNSVVWNQILNNTTFVDSSYWYSDRSEFRIEDGVAHIKATNEFSNLFQKSPLIEGHKYLIWTVAKGNGYRLNLNLCGHDMQGVYLSDNYAPHYFFAQPNVLSSDIVQIYVVENDADWYVKDYRVSDLTQMFGAGNEPSTIEEYNARKPIVEDEYAYNDGEVIHCNTESIKSVGDNAWDEQWEKGYIEPTSGIEQDSSAYIRSKNYNRIIGGEDYYLIGNHYNIVLYDENYQWLDYWGAIGEPRKVSIDSKARYFKVSFSANYGTTYKHDTLISLYHSGWKQDTDAGYQPYWQDTLPLPIIKKYFPDGMKSAGSAHDEIRYNKASGKWEKVVRIGSVDLGTLNWYHDASLGGFYSDTLVGAKKLFDGICAKYPFVGDYRNVTDKTCGYVYELCVLVKDSAYTDAASFKAAMQGVILYYELAEPVIREIDEPIGTDYRVADFGTEQAISSIPSAPFSADIIYQFNAVDMIRELWLKVQELESRLAQL